ncbi:R3H domain-containing protein 4 [Ixodes scapularis]|uniref:R3H domain-containing protein 4 n=1 Tax=Ixodes scapularis TaxID=6945 RepID=UPI001AD63D66|nr:R3H domain-containing protein 4 [Ixodes scapularis]
MGVIRNFANLPDPFHQPQDVLEELLGQGDERDLEQPPAQPAQGQQQQRRQRRSRSQPQHNDCCIELVGLSARGKRKSGKKGRRLENANYLQSLADDDEVGQLSIYDFVRDSVSAFSWLMADPQNRKIWDDLLDCTGEPDEEPEASERLHPVAHEDLTKATADACFQRLDTALRSLLCRQHVPLGTLCVLEERLAESFLKEPRSEQCYCLASSFDRLLLHALCQYMSLLARSYDSDGERWTRVRNLRPKFDLPAEALSTYLERRRCS